VKLRTLIILSSLKVIATLKTKKVFFECFSLDIRSGSGFAGGWVFAPYCNQCQYCYCLQRNEKEAAGRKKHCYRSVATTRFARLGYGPRQRIVQGRPHQEAIRKRHRATGAIGIPGAGGGDGIEPRTQGKSEEHSTECSKDVRECWCKDYQAIRDLRHFILNGWDGPLPEGWVGEVHDISTGEKKH